MKTQFAFLMHPVDLHQVKTFWPLTRILPSSFIRPFLKNESFKIIPLRNLHDKQGNEVNGVVLMSPIHPDEIVKQDDETIFDRIIAAGALREKLGFKILGLGGYYGAVADKKSMLYKHMKIPVTTGSAFTAWSIYEAAFKAAKKNNRELTASTVTILSPVNTVGMLCSRKFSGNAARVILSGDKLHRLELMAKNVQTSSPGRVDIENDLSKAVAQADIVVNADPLHCLLDSARLRPGAIFCDASIFGDALEKADERKGICAIDCKAIATPFDDRLDLYLDLPQHSIYPALAETMLLALEQNFVNFSLGNNVNPDKIDYIANIASRHNFHVQVPGGEIT